MRRLLAALLIACACSASAETVIIYDRDDTRSAMELRRIARIWGPVWMDIDLRPGDPWRVTIAHRICRADIVLLIWSDRAAQSAEVAAEWRHALACGRRVVPVLVDSESLPAELGRVQAVDCVMMCCPGSMKLRRQDHHLSGSSSMIRTLRQ